MAGLYLVGAWLVVQVVDILLPMFGVADWVARGVVLLLAIGFLPALIFAWVFELTPEGLKRDDEVPLEQSIAPRTAKRMDRMIVAGLLVVIVLMAAERLWPRGEAAIAVVATTPGSSRGGAGSPPGASIAVLPLANLSGDPSQDYFSDGMSEELLDGLSKVPGLRVAARTSAFQFKGRNIDIHEIAGRLNVATVLEGSLRKSGNRIRITTQLIDGGTGFHLWSETYDRELDDIFAVQDEISAKVVEQLRAKLGLEDAGLQPTPTRVTNAEAYDAYLRGREALRNRSPETVAQGLVDLQRATELDPGYAPAWASLAEAIFHSRQASTGVGEMSIDEAIARGRAALAEARRLNPELADVHAVEGLFQQYFDGDISAAMIAVDAAIARNPNHAQALFSRADLLNRFGRYRESLEQSLALAHIDPFYERNNRAIVRALAMFGRMAEATPHIERMSREPTRSRFRELRHSFTGEWDLASLANVTSSKELMGWFGGRQVIAEHLIMLGLFNEAAVAAPAEEQDLAPAARGDWLEAIEAFDAPGFAGLYKNRDQFPFFRRGHYLFRAGRIKDSIEQFSRVKHVWPHGLADDVAYDSPRRIWYALALREVGRAEDAAQVEDVTRADVAAARRDGINTPLVDLLSAELALWDGKPEEALALLPRGLRADPFLPSIEGDPAYAAVRDRAEFKRAVAAERARRSEMRTRFLQQTCAAPAKAEWRPLPDTCATLTANEAKTP